MDAKEILGRVKALFTELAGGAPAPPAAPEAPKEYELKDGGKVAIDKLEVGGIVMIDGNPALPGDLELADGTKLTVGDNGAITALGDAAAGDTPAIPAPPSAEDMGAKFTAFETLTSEKFASYEAKFAAYENKFAEYEVKLEKYNEMITQLLQFGKLMVEAPAAAPDPAARPSGNFNEQPVKKYSNILFNS